MLRDFPNSVEEADSGAEENMRSTFVTVVIGVLVVATLVAGGYFLVRRLVSADVESQTKSADFNRDGKIDGLDLNILLKAVADKSENPKFDLNGDGKVDSSDADQLSRQWND